MTGLVDRPLDARDDQRAAEGARLAGRVAALGRFLDAAAGHVPEDRLVPARTVVERADQRLALSQEHTIVALAGSTGSGKSSLFNTLARMQLSPVGVRRPTTGVTYACVWGSSAGADELLDWLGMLPRHRFARESALDGEDQASLRGLVLLDLPDFDSVEMAHRAEVDRLLGLADLVVWIVDPQKYADKVIHETYFSQLRQHQDVTVVALNQADRLSPADQQRCLDDLRGLLDRAGLSRVTTLVSSAAGPPGDAALRRVLESTVTRRQAVLDRLDADIDRAFRGLSTMVSTASADDVLERTAGGTLADALAQAAGVPAVVEAAKRAYRLRASSTMGWPLLRWVRRLQSDPLQRLDFSVPSPSTVDDGVDQRPPQERSSSWHDRPSPVTAPLDPTPAQRAAVGIAVRAVADRVAGALPAPWPAAAASAGRARVDDLPVALDRAVTGIGVSMLRTPVWWRLVGGLQWLVTFAGLGGLLWLLGGYLLGVIVPPAPQFPKFGALSLPAVLLLTGLLGGLLIATLARVLVALATRRAGLRAEARLRAAVADVGREYVLVPVRGVLHAYAQARAALAAAGSK